MASIGVVMISIIFIITNTGEAADLNPDKDFPTVTPEVEGKCPPLGNVDYQVTVMGTGSSKIAGCAAIDNSSSDPTRASFVLWFGSLPENGQRCGHHDMKHFDFDCQSKSTSMLEDTDEGRKFVKLNGRSVHKTGRTHNRCALYETINGHDTKIRMVVSRNASCDGLSNILSHPQLIFSESNKGSMLLQLNKTIILDAPLTTPEAPLSTSPPTKSMVYSSNWWFVLQHFGRELSPVMRTGRVAVQAGNKRLRRSTSKYANSTSKTDVIVSAGINPFVLMLSNRKHYNNTCTLKPIGMWDQILDIFRA